MIFKRRNWLTLLLAFALPTGTMAQQVQISPKRGWIGITIDLVSSNLSGEEKTVALIREVVEHSPAAAAGIRVGDTITHLDGQPLSQKAFSALTRSLEPGDLVRMTLSRAGRSREVLVETGSWPTPPIVTVPDVGEWEIKFDSVRGAILQNLDSLRLSFTGLRLDTLGELSVEILRVPSPPDESRRISWVFRAWENAFDTLTFGPGIFALSPDEGSLPFEAFLVQSEATDSLKGQLRDLRKTLTDVRRRELTRLSELQAGSRGQVTEFVLQDEIIRKLREEEELLVQEQQVLNERIRKLSEEEMKRRWVDAQAEVEAHFEMAQRAQAQAQARERHEEDREATQRAREAYEEARTLSGLRPLTPLILGQDFVAGAQLKPLVPELAEYFQVDQGLLVTEVVPGTPAADAGMMAGDVIVRVGGERVSSLEDIRFGLGYLEGPLRIGIIRKGEAREIVIRK